MTQTLEELIEVIDLLSEKNEVVPIIVEGRNAINIVIPAHETFCI